MLALCAYYEGTPADPAAFDRHVEDAHLPLVARYPHLRALRYLKGMPRDGVAPKFYLSFQLFFDSVEDFRTAAGSDERNHAVLDAEAMNAEFNGEIHHVMYEVHDITIA